MILQILAAIVLLTAVYDAYLTRRRICDYGIRFELNGMIRWLSTHLGPELGVAVGVLGPVVGWLALFLKLNALWPVALWAGYALKRFEVHVVSAMFEKNVRAIKQMLDEHAKAAENKDGEDSDHL